MVVCHVGEIWGVQSLSMGIVFLAPAQVSLPTGNHAPSGHGDYQSHTSTMQMSHSADAPLLRPCAIPPETIYGPLPQEKPCVVP
jgi:hypothetical protein